MFTLSKGFQMLKQLFGTIFGIPNSDLSAKLTRSARPLKPSRQYVPESSLSEVEIEGGIGDDGSCYSPWREDPASGEMWYVRTSYDASGPAASIKGILPTDDDELDEFVPRTSEMIRRDAKMKFQAMQQKRRALGWPMDDDDAFEDIDDDEI